MQSEKELQNTPVLKWFTSRGLHTQGIFNHSKLWDIGTILKMCLTRQRVEKKKEIVNFVRPISAVFLN